MEPDTDRVPVLDLLLNKENPRHDPKKNQEEIIEYLCADEQVENLARHISLHGPNPLEQVAVFKSEGNLVVAEGNRRVCAMQLLNDPERAPASLRARFRKLSQNKLVPAEIGILIFDEYAEAKPWLDIIHGGQQDGVGRRTWNAEQKTRSISRNSRDTLAQRILDYAEQIDALTAADRRKISLTTASRYINNPDVRSAMGITTGPTEPEVTVDISEAKFDQVVSRFVGDLKTKKLTSRSTSKQWREYGAAIRKDLKPEESKEAPRGLFESSVNKPKGRKATLKPKIPKRIPRSDKIVDELNRINSLKLANLYRSLTGLSLKEHPALLMAGAWIFLESATALHGRSEGNSFESYLNSKFNQWGIARDRKKELGVSVKYISDHGNAEKHGKQFTTLNAENLVTHFDVLNDEIAKLLSEVKKLK